MLLKSFSAIETRIGLCSVGQGWTTDASYEWNTELRSGIPFEAPVSLRFTEPGDIPIFIVVLDMQNNRIAGIGRLIYVKPKEQSSAMSFVPYYKEKSSSQSLVATLLANPQWQSGRLRIFQLHALTDKITFVACECHNHTVTRALEIIGKAGYKRMKYF